MPGARPGTPPGRSVRSRTAQPTPLRARLTGRAAVLVLVLVALMVSYASSMRAYLEQRQHIAGLQESIATSEADIKALRREKARWDDPAYVIAQARARFAFGFPGEIGYQVLDQDGQPLDHEDTLSTPLATEDGEPEWWQATLDSIDSAGNPPREEDPATRIKPPSTNQKKNE